jgi:hypothetical protein
MNRAAALALCSLLAPGLLAAQGVLVAPTSVFLDSRGRTATMLLVNPNDDAVEVTLSTTYGYAITDSAGRFQAWLTDTPDSTAPNAAPWIRIFPRRASIEPKAQQVVRLLITPPPELPEGEYWARLVVLASGGKLAVSAPTPRATRWWCTRALRTPAMRPCLRRRAEHSVILPGRCGATSRFPSRCMRPSPPASPFRWIRCPPVTTCFAWR